MAAKFSNPRSVSTVDSVNFLKTTLENVAGVFKIW